MGKRIIEFYYNHFPSWFKELMRSLYNVGYYARWVWQDRNWECDNIYTIMALKFRKVHYYRTRKYNFDYMPSKNGDRLTALMKEAAILCDRLSGPCNENPLFNFHQIPTKVKINGITHIVPSIWKHEMEVANQYKDRLNYILKYLDRMWD